MVMRDQIVNRHLLTTSQFFLAGLAAASLIITLLPWADYLYYDAVKVADGQLWRPFTAWLVQANITHWVLNLWGLVLMAFVLPARLTGSTLLAFIGIWLFASICLLRSDYQAYVGLSGVLYGWICWSIAISPFYKAALKLIVISVIALKVIIENSPLPWLKEGSVAQWIGRDIAYEAHLWGLLGGGLMMCLYGLFLLSRLGDERHG